MHWRIGVKRPDQRKTLGISEAGCQPANILYLQLGMKNTRQESSLGSGTAKISQHTVDDTFRGLLPELALVEKRLLFRVRNEGHLY